MILANLLHLSFNMWEEHDVPSNIWRKARRRLWFEDAVWDEVIRRMADAGYNMLVLDIGDGIQYQSHPEVAVEGAWAPQRLTDETARLKSMGIELIPKLNFSTCHDEWLGVYSRCVSTPIYYQVCRDLIAEVARLTGHPRFFHIGMDEETAELQRRYNFVVVRQHQLYWDDMRFFAEHVEAQGCRPWIWSDSIWNHPQEFLKNVPRSILQSNWYYGTTFTDADAHPQAYRTLENHGYDQLPTCSNFSHAENAQLTVDFCRRHVAPERLLGFMQTPWRPTVAEYRDNHIQAIETLAKAAVKSR